MARHLVSAHKEPQPRGTTDLWLLFEFIISVILISSQLLSLSPLPSYLPHSISFLSYNPPSHFPSSPILSHLLYSPNCPLFLNRLSPHLSSPPLSCPPFSSPLLCGCVSSVPPSGQHLFLRPVLVLLLNGARRVWSPHGPGGLRGINAARPLAGHPEDLEVSVETVVQP